MSFKIPKCYALVDALIDSFTTMKALLGQVQIKGRAVSKAGVHPLAASRLALLAENLVSFGKATLWIFSFKQKGKSFGMDPAPLKISMSRKRSIELKLFTWAPPQL